MSYRSNIECLKEWLEKPKTNLNWHERKQLKKEAKLRDQKK
jgi:hypothetical protein